MKNILNTSIKRLSSFHNSIQQEEQSHDQYYPNNGVTTSPVDSGNIIKGAHHIQYIKDQEGKHHGIQLD